MTHYARLAPHTHCVHLWLKYKDDYVFINKLNKRMIHDINCDIYQLSTLSGQTIVTERFPTGQRQSFL